MATKSTTRPVIPCLAKIARTLGFVTLQPRNVDRLDFKEISVWQMREALEQAYAAGAASVQPLRVNRAPPRQRRYRYRDTLGNVYTMFVNDDGVVALMNQHGTACNSSTVAGLLNDLKTGTDDLAADVNQAARDGLAVLRARTGHDWSEVKK